MVKLSAVTALGLLSLAGHAMAQQTIKVMPFGASIVTRCWRNNLEQKLRNAGVTNFDMVGSQKGSQDCLSQFPGTDSDHEGHPGSQATDYAAMGNLTTWLAQQPAVDVVIMLLGHNDIILGHKPQDQIVKAYDTLIAQMRTKNPRVQIVWSNLTPIDPKRWSTDNANGVAALSAKITQYAVTKTTYDSPVRLARTYESYDPVADTEDGEHPNKSGNEKLANKFLSPTIDAIQGATKTRRIMGLRRGTSDFANVVQDFLEDQKK